MTDIEDSTVLLRRLGDRYAALLNDLRGVIRTAVSRAGGHEIDARADEFFAVFGASHGRSGSRRGDPAGNRSPGLDRRSTSESPCRDPQRPPDADRCRLHRSGGSHHGGVSARPLTEVRSSCPQRPEQRSGHRPRPAFGSAISADIASLALTGPATRLPGQAQGLRVKFPPPRTGRSSIPRRRDGPRGAHEEKPPRGPSARAPGRLLTPASGARDAPAGRISP